jgi:AraC-like DNA-binding protein
MKMKPGECIVILPGIIHNVYLNKKSSCKFIDIVFMPCSCGVQDYDNRAGAIPFFRLLTKGSLSYFRFYDSAILKSTLENIQLLYKSGNGLDDLLLKLDFCKMYLIFSKALVEMESAMDKAENAHVKKATKFIRENYTNNISLHDVAKTVDISGRHLTRLFSDEIGMTVQDYITILKINKAKELLRIVDRNITQVAFELGFSSSDYFSSFFKKHEGLSPREFKKAYQQRANFSYSLPNDNLDDRPS